MNRNQWFVFGVGLILLSMFMFFEASSWGMCSTFLDDGDLYVGCVIRRYAFSVSAIISLVLGWIFTICGFLEPKKKD
ncbi:hypothetical protein KAT24_01685 [Candidatus Pacearchaeota archaeon]|nr:hypothetical protein [Candidatus Pacearchaeota archaeon]